MRTSPFLDKDYSHEPAVLEPLISTAGEKKARYTGTRLQHPACGPLMVLSRWLVYHSLDANLGSALCGVEPVQAPDIQP
ncbi:hypothetical protein N7510_001862 [Penicillium lagena]|uniref:uncharacterized protein n=1 Tax=Penicillium lagena TaxID=94218 RepID=UPI0025412F73|nr:uncharacterized protein N7510_001862 [Penicillium lagena]KAJ5625553.1 hypothetical protein N7510_001862 [Penicillium lagena]